MAAAIRERLLGTDESATAPSEPITIDGEVQLLLGFDRPLCCRREATRPPPFSDGLPPHRRREWRRLGGLTDGGACQRRSFSAAASFLSVFVLKL